MKETVEEAAGKANGYNLYAKETKGQVFNEGFICGAKWQSEQDNWISVEERLPTDSEQVLMYTKYNATMYGFYSEGIWYETYNGMVCLNVHKVVTHWQPLPHPPKA
jgi:hypothetical protein